MKTLAAAAVLGGILFVAGVVLLVLPWLGFVLIAAGLAILASRLPWAKRPLDYAKNKAEQGIREVAQSPWRAALALFGALGLIALGLLGLAGVDLPLLNALSAVIVSGFLLIGTIVNARMQLGDKVQMG